MPLKGRDKQFAINDILTVKIIEWIWDESNVATVVEDSFEVISEPNTNSWNLAEASPTCTFFGGTFRNDLCSTTSNETSGTLYSHNSSGLHQWGKMNLTGDITWNVITKNGYVVNSCENTIYKYDWNSNTDALCKMVLNTKVEMFYFNVLL